MAEKLNTDELKKLRDKLPNKYAETLAESTGFSKSLIYAVLAGHRQNDEIMECALELATANSEKRKNHKHRVKEILDT
jgi:hypothetical protein